MIITESAANAILGIMKKTDLDPETIVLRFDHLDNGALGFTFSKENNPNIQNFHGLKVLLGNNSYMVNTIIDFGEINGKKGIIFMENKNDN